MAIPYNLTPDWDIASRHIVALDGDLILANSGGQEIRWARTVDDTTPASEPMSAHMLRPGQSLTLPFRAGDRIWMAADPAGTALVDQLP